MIKDEQKLILIAEDEPTVSSTVCKYLEIKGFKTISASNGAEALALFKEKRPHLVITDLRMPVMDGLQFLNEARKYDSSTPFIITTAFPALNTAIDAIHNGAFDYILKPFQLESLYQKINQALNASRLEKENMVLSRLASLHEVTGRLTGTHDLKELLDFTLQACISILRADGCLIQLLDKKANELRTVRQHGIKGHIEKSAILNPRHDGLLFKWIIKNRQSILIANGRTFPDTSIYLDSEDTTSSISVPLIDNDDVFGIISLIRSSSQEPFSVMDLNTLDVLSSQASIAINNAYLYSSVNQKLDELSLICTYSEQLMGLVDKKEVVECLFKTIHRYFPVDILGFLLIQKRFHNFLYWSRGEIPEEYLDSILEEVIQSYNKESTVKVLKKRVSLQRIFIESKETFSSIETPLAFRHISTITWEDFNFGAVFFGSSKEPEKKEEKIYLLSSIVSQTRIGLTNAKLYSDMKENYIRTIKALAIAVDAKDTYTHGHSENVMNIAEAIAEEMNMDKKWVEIIRDAGLLHDIGKIGIPGYILNKPGPLTAEEFNGIMKTHCTLGANIVKDVPFLQYLYSLILYHHENYDGTGYPEGLKGEEVPLGARILHVADAFEAMTSNRPYRDSLGKKEAFSRLEHEMGKQFDPEVVKAFFRFAKKKGWIGEN